MELAKALRLIKSNFLAIIVFGLITGAVVWGLASMIKPTYTAGLTVYVQKSIENPANGEYTYDGYYAQQAAEAYTDTVVGLLESRSIIAKAASALNRSTPKELEAYVKSIAVKKSAPLLISLSATTDSPDEASTLVHEVFTSAQTQIAEQSTNGKYVVALVDDAPLVKENKLPVELIAVIGSLLGISIYMTGLFFREYLKEHA
ncbi:hypothetical protein HGA91_01550 [candidate division WWE3 bacterium]|nr:hypothetical protein [candidate division WWE3 bacterium]